MSLTKIRGINVGENLQFTQLSDVPASYTGHGGKVVKVTMAEDGLEFGTAGGGGLDDAGVAALIADDTPSDTRAALDDVISEAVYPDALLGTDIADAFSIAHATIRGNVLSSSGAPQAAGLNAAVTKPVSGIISLGEIRVDAGSDVAFVVVDAGGDGIAYTCSDGQWKKSTVTAGVPGSPSPLAFGFGKTATVLLTSTGTVALVVEGALFSSDALFASDPSVLTLINMAGTDSTVVYTSAGDKYVYDYSQLGLGEVKDVLGRTIKPIGKIRPVGPVYPMVEGGSNPRKYMGFAPAGTFDIDAKIKFEGINIAIATLTYSGGNVASGALVVVGAGAVVSIDSIDCGSADISTVVAVEKGGIVTCPAISGTGTITDNFNQAPMTDTVDGFIRSALTQAH